MRESRGVERITAAYDMPAVIKDNIKVDGEPRKSIEARDDASHTTNQQKETILVTTGDMVPNEMSTSTSTSIQLDDAKNDNQPKKAEPNKSARMIHSQNDEDDQHKTINSAGDGSSKAKNYGRITFDVSSRGKSNCGKHAEFLNGIDGVDDEFEKNKARSTTASTTANDSEAAGSNDQRSSEVTSAVTKSNKRKISISSEDEQPPPAKNLRTELESNLATYDKILHGMLEKSTSSNDPENVQHDIDQLSSEIETLSDAARAKELEWNNILYLKKMKEDMLVRLNRKKSVMEIMTTKIIDDPENLIYNMNNNNNNNSNCNDDNLVETTDNFVDKHDVMDVRKQLANSIVPTTSFVMSRCSLDIAKERSNMNSSDLAKEKSNISKLHRNIRSNSQNCSDATMATATSTNFVTSIPRSSPAMQLQQEFLQQRLREEAQHSIANQDNSANKMQVGRQGPIKDVKSLIDDFRQRHPEQVPRRGRRMKNVNPNAYFGDHGNNSSGLGDNNDMSSPPSSNDSSYNNNSQLLIASTKIQTNNAFGTAVNKQSFGDLNSKIGNNPLTSTPLFKNQQNTSLGYPEVTLHPIQSSSSLLQNQKHGKDNVQPETAHTNSLLHGILTKSSRQRGSSTVTSGMTSSAAGLSNSFSPTLARLLTAPERNFAMGSVQTPNTCGNSNNNSFFGAAQVSTAGVNLTKNGTSRMQQQLHQNQPEISCLPISQILAFQQQNQSNSLLHQQLQRHQRDINKYRPKTNAFMCGTDDDEAEDSVDRLVIDEGDQYSNSDIAGPSGLGRSNNDNELPECQGCKKREAQFVCADCQRQWYCSRECQVLAWDEHSEVCAR